jgi:ribosomal protein L11 methyltransferase
VAGWHLIIVLVVVLVLVLESEMGQNKKELKMKVKALWRVSVATTPEAEDAVAELLGVTLHQPVSTWLNLETGVCTVNAYLLQQFMDLGAPASRRRVSSRPAGRRRSQEQVRKEILEGLHRIKKCGLNTGSGKITITKLRHEDWAESWKRHFPPIEIGRELLIKPSWSKRRARRNQEVVVLDPGLSFGTGQHPTTAFCLRELVRCGKNRAGRSFLDMGTGSGILAMAAAKLGYSPVHALDIDPEAVRVSRANARTNGVQGKLRISRQDVAKLPIRPGRQYDLICANLLSTLLIAERRRIVARLKPAGILVLAGILKPEFPRVRRAFAEFGLKLAATETRNEWRSGSFGFAKKKFGKI